MYMYARSFIHATIVETDVHDTHTLKLIELHVAWFDVTGQFNVKALVRHSHCMY